MASVAALHLRWKSNNRWWFGLGYLLLLLATKGYAQPTRLATPTKPAAPVQAPASIPNQLSPQKMEEALRLLLRADSVASQRQRARLGPESSGLVVDQTITKIGHDFYDQFYSRWEAPADNDDFIIIISEKPSRSNNNAIVTVVVNDEELLEFPLQGKYDIIEETNQQVMEVVSNFLQQARNLSKQLEKGNRQPIETY